MCGKFEYIKKPYVMNAGIIYIECDGEKQLRLTNNYKSIASLTGANNLICMFKRTESLREFLSIRPSEKLLVVSNKPVEELECLKKGSLSETPLMIYDTLSGTDYERAIKQVESMGYIAKWYNNETLFKNFGANVEEQS